MTFNLKISTPHGEFTRKATRAYTHAVVRSCPRALEAFQNHTAKGCKTYGGVQGRWAKDRGFAVTWHGSEQAARNAAAGNYDWDHSAVVLGIFPVTNLSAPKVTDEMLEAFSGFGLKAVRG
jgi:hypothetical protein